MGGVELSVGPVFMTISVVTDSPIKEVANELREILNADSQNKELFPKEQERDGLNHNGEYWLFGLLDDVRVVLMNNDDRDAFEIYIGTTDYAIGEPLAAKLARMLFKRGYQVSLV